jgi:S1-C subfamily serine protease
MVSMSAVNWGVMSLGLTSDDVDKVVSVLAGLPQFRAVQGRVDLLTDVFAGTPRGEDIIASLDLDGPPRSVAVRVVRQLQLFGQDEPGREALGVLINKALSYLGAGERAETLRDVLRRYPFTVPPTADGFAMGVWRGTETPATVAEKIIGENTLRDVYVLELALDAARAVVRVRTPSSLGTGFMVSRNLMMTNHHVIPDAGTAAESSFNFNYQMDRRRRATPVWTGSAQPGGLFYSNPALDVAVVELAPPQVEFRPLVLRGARAHVRQRVAIIQHPGGHHKKISMQNNFVVYADERIIQYTTSTEPGSSGSPVFAESFDVIGVHHAGGALSEPGSADRYLRNEGISAIAVLDDLARSAPHILTQLEGQSGG